MAQRTPWAQDGIAEAMGVTNVCYPLQTLGKSTGKIHV